MGHTFIEISKRIPDDLCNYFAGLTAEQRQAVRAKLQKRRTRTSADKQGKELVLACLDKADEQAKRKAKP